MDTGKLTELLASMDEAILPQIPQIVQTTTKKFVDITPGGAEELIEDGGMIYDTEPPIDMEKLISKFVFGKV